MTPPDLHDWIRFLAGLLLASWCMCMLHIKRTDVTRNAAGTVVAGLCLGLFFTAAAGFMTFLAALMLGLIP